MSALANGISEQIIRERRTISIMSSNKTSPSRLSKTGTTTVIQVSEAAVKRGDSSLSNSTTGSESKFNLDRTDAKTSVLSVVFKLTVSALCGLVFGFVMEKARGKFSIFFIRTYGHMDRRQTTFLPSLFQYF